MGGGAEREGILRSVHRNMFLQKLLVFFSTQIAKVLGNIYIRKYYHLWLAFLVTFGPLLQFYANPKAIFAKKNNYFNIYFVYSGWGWTCSFLGGFIFLLAYLSTRRILTALRHLSRLLVGTLIWFASTETFFFIENITGSCIHPVSEGLLLNNITNKRECLKEGHQWNGYDISGHTFLLIYCSFVIVEELHVFYFYLQRGKPAGVPLHLIFLLNCILLCLWNIMLLITVVYFHQYSEKIVGAAIATVCWHFTYNIWYRTRWSPGRPGHRLFTKVTFMCKRN
ncbi:fat storage-inducing transmembrane protein 1 [Protopterus annectens]|uniref:fat storage-inducing transmembrane protein 1 n=1 Tax=Protopterus annectens TaxID=7888 RepID=UPI001CFA6391|nr:fat storage-inducing transmembrane protein 1 [Protopterus annectens]